MTHPIRKIESSASSSWVEPLLADFSDFDGEDIEELREAISMAARGDPGVDVDKVVQSIEEDRAAAWELCDPEGVRRGFVVTQMIEYTTGHKSMVIHSAALLHGFRTTSDCMRHVVEFISKIAQSQGMDSVRICGRKGWAKILPEFHEVERVFEKIVKEVH